ncbi:Major facilitator superfamily domain-containing protein 6 [Armadillidium nasatum]|uniref:Major facilitator superfamily domain-containing protein 6 n=1 Tax=Armadillidium nasatum TaxID=96803 RepID=A0A5N5SS91_9CRUS|nr:Major facilitator superfamily domain-containing protein 6 [Armadillidium nasatum]
MGKKVSQETEYEKAKQDEEEEAPKETLTSKLKKKLTINKDLLPIKAILFCHMGGAICFLPYLTLHMEVLGIDMDKIALIYAFLPIAAIGGPIISGMIADKFGSYTKVLSANVFLSAFFHTLLLTIPPSVKDTMEFNCDASNFSLGWRECSEDFMQYNLSNFNGLQNCRKICSEESTPEYNLFFLNSLSNVSLATENSIDEKILFNGLISTSNSGGNCFFYLSGISYNDSSYDSISCPNDCPLRCDVIATSFDGSSPGTKSLTFYLYFLYRILATLFISSAFSMIDAVVLEKVKSNDGDYGRQRVVFHLSQAILPFISGLTVDLLNTGNDSVDYSSSIYMGDVLLGITIIIALTMKFEVEPTKDDILKNVGKLLARVEIDIFLLVIFFLGMNWGFLETYLFLYLDELKAPTYLLGLTLSVGCASGIPAMMYSDLIVEKIGRGNIFLISFIAYVIRFVGYSYINSPWLCFPFEILEIFTYQLMWVAAATYCPILAPKGLLATMTGIAGSVHYSLGRGMGSFIGGCMINWIGLRLTFRSLGYATLVAAVLQFLADRFILRKKVRQREKIRELATFTTREVATKAQVEDDLALPEVANMIESSSRKSSIAV